MNNELKMRQEYWDPFWAERKKYAVKIRPMEEKKKAGAIKAARMTAWRVAMLILYCCCLRRADIYGVITDFYILLYALVNTPLIAGPLLYQLEGKYGIPIRVLYLDLLLLPIVLLEIGGNSRPKCMIRREIRIRIEEDKESWAATARSDEEAARVDGRKDDQKVAGVAPVSLRIEEKVIVLLSAVSMPNLASQLGSPSASPLDLVLAAAAIVLYIVAVLAAVYGYLLGTKRPDVWRYSVIVGSVCTVYAFFCSIALYLPEASRWLIVLPCTALLPAFYLAIRDSDFGR